MDAKLQRRRADEEAAKAEDARLKLEAFQFLSGWERVSLKPVPNPMGGMEIGLSHVLDDNEMSSRKLEIDGNSVQWENGITRDQAYKLFAKDIQKYLRHLDRIVKVKLNRNQRLALLSFFFNWGTNESAYPTLLNRVNQGRFEEVPDVFMIYVKVGGSIHAGLQRRRQAEADLWKKPP